MPEKPSLSIKQKQARQLKFRVVLKNDLGLKPYKKPDLHEIETSDYPNTYGQHINDK